MPNDLCAVCNSTVNGDDLLCQQCNEEGRQAAPPDGCVKYVTDGGEITIREANAMSTNEPRDEPSGLLTPSQVDIVPFETDADDACRYLMIRKDVALDDVVTQDDVFGIACDSGVLCDTEAWA